MRKIFLFTLFLTCAASFLNISYSQDEDMKKWMDYMTPGDQHKQMSKCSGDWKVNTKMWMAPGGEPTVTDGTASAEMILGGRYLVTKHKATMMGMPFEGMSIDGYDNATKMFNSVWLDNMGTGIMFMTGKWNEATKTTDYTGKMVNPLTAGYEDIRSVLKMNDENTMTMEMFGPGPDGKEFKSMVITYTR
jgi:hypothetical protein